MADIPPHVAAYAAALHHAGVGTWGDVAELVRKVGLGAHRFDELAKVSTAWSRAHVHPSAIRALAKRRKEPHPRG